MIDFKNGEFIKLSKTKEIPKLVQDILIEEEKPISAYKGIRDIVVFTTKRIIAINVQGLTGKKKDFTSLPYSKIQAFSVETAGMLDLDAELELYFSGIGKVRFEFSGACDIVAIGRVIGRYVL